MISRVEYTSDARFSGSFRITRHTTVGRDDMSASRALPFVQKVWSSFLQTSGMEPHLLKSLEIQSASAGLVTARLKVEPHHCVRLFVSVPLGVDGWTNRDLYRIG